MDLARFWWSDQAAGPGGGGNSLRFRGAQHLARTPAVNGNSNVWTFSAWIKKGQSELDTNTTVTILSAELNVSNKTHVMFARDAKIMTRRTSVLYNPTTSAQYRDPSAWYHVVWVYNDPEAAEANRVEIFVNGVKETLTGGTFPNQNDNRAFVNTGQEHRIGIQGDNAGPFEGYLAEVYLVDGQALDPTDFGAFDANGVWVPTPYAGTYGTNGFYLDFSDPADIGADRSGNGNDFTPNGFELGDNTSVDWDHMTDHPTSNFGTLNPLVIRTKTIGVDGGPTEYLNANQQAGFGTVAQWRTAITGTGTLTGEFFWEATIVNAGTTGRTQVGWTAPGAVGFSDADTAAVELFYRQNGNFRIGVGGMEAYGVPWGTGDVIGCRIDLNTTGIVEYFVNGVSQGIAANDLFARTSEINLGMGFAPHASPNNADPAGSSGAVIDFNLGQRPFRFDQGVQGYAVVNANAAQIPNGRDHFQAITDTGANILGAAQAAFPTGLWWIKDRVNSNEHQLVNHLDTETSVIRSPNNSDPVAYTAPAGDSVAWCWNASNPAVNGFNIIRPSLAINTADQDVAHGCPSAPEFIIWEYGRNSGGGNTRVWHHSLPEPEMLWLNSNNPVNTAVGQITDVTNTQMHVSTGTGFNTDPFQTTMYCWAPIPGYSAFGSYTGNGSADGPFIYTGFRPAFLLIKNISGTFSWDMFDSTRSINNPVNALLMPDRPDGEDVANTWNFDFLSNGFKVRTSNAGINGSGNTIVYAAFAEVPTGGNNVSPANAR